MRALVTGSLGFAGRHLVAHLQSLGDEVRGFDAECDVADVEAVADAVRAARPEVVYHLAAASHVGDSWGDPSTVMRTNVQGTASLLAAVRREAPRARTLVVSSAEVYGKVPEERQPITENEDTSPLSPYGASKLAAEDVARQAVRGYGQDVVVVRPFNHVGPGQSAQFFVPALAERLVAARASGAKTVPVGTLVTRRDLTDVRDVVRAYRLLAERAESGVAYNVCSGVTRSMGEVAHALRDLVDPALRFEEDPALLRPAEVTTLQGDHQRLTSATSWEPMIDFTTTLADVIEAAGVAAAETS
jgi:GDP-4-dehydro-6-deoxy-D-mannose reductase